MRCFNQALRIHRLTQKGGVFPVKHLDLAMSAEVELARIGPISMQRNYGRFEGRGACDLFTWRLSMLGLFARWGHNVLITTMALLTIALVASLIR
jgi:hypothetical protein